MYQLKKEHAESIGIYSDDNRYSSKITENDLLDKIESLNNDPKIHVFLVQLPLPLSY